MDKPKSRRGGNYGGGRPPTPVEEKTHIRGKVRVMLDPEKEMVILVDPETRVLAQRLMLRNYPGVTKVEELFAYAVQFLASTTDD